MRRKGWLVLTLLASGADAASTLSLGQLARQGYVTSLRCFAAWKHCEGTTPLAPNAFAGALGLAAPTGTGRDWAWDTAGRGWRVQHQASSDQWTVRLTPLGRSLTRQELQAYPEPRRALPASPPQRAQSTPGGQEIPSPTRSGGGGVATAPEVPGTSPGRAAPPRLLTCTVVVDVRSLGKMTRDMTSFVYDAQGRQLWPDTAFVRGVSSALVQEGNIHTYITSEAQLRAFPNVTRVRALRLQAPRIAPNARVFTDAVLGPTSTHAFQAAGQGCRVVYLMTS